MVVAALMASTGIGVSVQKALLDQTVESVSKITISRPYPATEYFIHDLQVEECTKALLFFFRY